VEIKDKIIRMPKELFDIITADAKNRRMPLNALIILILADYIRNRDDEPKRRGYL
jgi:hypothetical protein